MSAGDDVAVVGVGIHQFGRHDGVSGLEMGAIAARRALADAGVAWQDIDVPQCGYCQSGQIMSAVALLKRNPNPTEGEIRMGLEGNLCRCTGYHNIVKSIQAAAKVMAPGAKSKTPASVS